MILHVVNTVWKIIIEAVIDVISRWDTMGRMMRGLNLLQFVMLDKGADERSTGV